MTDSTTAEQMREAAAARVIAFCDAWQAKYGTDWVRSAFDAEMHGHELRTGDLRILAGGQP